MILLAKKRELQLAESLIPQVQKVQAELVEPSVLEEMSLAEYQQEKQLLEAKRKHLGLVLDKKKLKQAERIIDSMDMILDRIAEGYDREAVSAMDLKFLTDAYEKMQKSLERVVRMDSINSDGDAALISVEIRYGKR